MPVHRFRIGQSGEVLEVCVGEAGESLTETAVPVRSPGLAEAVAAIRAGGAPLPPGYGSEVNLRLPPWLAAVAATLDAGLALLIDYGYPQGAYYQPDRGLGTLMCHLRHRAHGDPYRHLGLQDITAHVDFSAAARAGAEAGLELAGFATQAHFLIGCGIDGLMAPSPGEPPDLDLVLGAKQLLLPQAMGERFKVLGLAKGIEGALAGPWRGFSIRDLRDRL
jgi:SAM-dependent MidA family methyltransferase